MIKDFGGIKKREERKKTLIPRDDICPFAMGFVIRKKGHHSWCCIVFTSWLNALSNFINSTELIQQSLPQTLTVFINLKQNFYAPMQVALLLSLRSNKAYGC